MWLYGSLQGTDSCSAEQFVYTHTVCVLFCIIIQMSHIEFCFVFAGLKDVSSFRLSSFCFCGFKLAHCSSCESSSSSSSECLSCCCLHSAAAETHILLCRIKVLTS